MSKFTKAPWIIDNDGDGIYSDTEEYQVAYISYINYNKNKEMQANARLIAAAPEMYELLDEIQKGYLEYGTIADWHCDKIFNILVRIDGEKV